MKVVEHFHYLSAQAQLRAALDNFRPGHMVFLIGPSGAGKTTLRHSVMQEMFGNPLMWGQGRIPAIEAFVKLPTAAFFSSRELVKTLVEELHVPSMNWLFSGATVEKSIEKEIRSDVEHCGAIWDQLRRHHVTEGEYWRIFERTLAARSCKYVSLDQVTALLVNRRNTSPADHTLHLMSIAESAGIMFIMTGVHHAAHLWSVHSELRRRVTPVWVPPYSHRRKSDEEHYLRLLKSLTPKYPLSRSDLLYSMADEILAATGGVFGEIVQLLARAGRQANSLGEKSISRRHLQAEYYNNHDLETLWRDIEAFEKAMESGCVSKRLGLIKASWRGSGSTAEGGV
jgi:ABC-type cobalamin/Fe3+-siderophores transport system ATPase subunit